jgi:hypothetical protein
MAFRRHREKAGILGASRAFARCLGIGALSPGMRTGLQGPVLMTISAPVIYPSRARASRGC